jgi:1,4-dihydroxy-2-naphthoate octaprenyltransferase
LSVLGSYYLQAQTLHLDVLFLSLNIGFLSVGVLNINNIRDIESDRQKNKWTIPAKIGKSKALIYHLVLLSLAFVFILSSVVSQLNLWLLIYFIAFSLFILSHYNQLSNCKTRNDYNAQLKKLSLGTFVFSISLIIIQFFF